MGYPVPRFGDNGSGSIAAVFSMPGETAIRGGEPVELGVPKLIFALSR